MKNKIVHGNYYDKYNSCFFVYKILVDGYLRYARELLALARPATVLEVGCGPGDLARRLVDPEGDTGKGVVLYHGIDISERHIGEARECCPGGHFHVASAYHLPFPDRSFDLVIACEVFEHLDRPNDAMREVHRVCGASFLISVPWEPVWRLSNMLRGKYLARLGNTPGHLCHFSRREIRRIVRSRFRIVAERRPFPWTMLLARR